MHPVNSHSRPASATRRQVERQVPLPQPVVTAARPVLQTLGELRFNGAAGRLVEPRIALTLLTYLARRSSRSVERRSGRPFLAGTHPANARQSLRQVLLELKRLLGDGLVLDHEGVCRVPDTVAVDATSFEMEIRAGHWDVARDYYPDAGADLLRSMTRENEDVHSDPSSHG